MATTDNTTGEPTPLTPTEQATLTALMGVMECVIESDIGECPSCDTGYCTPHGLLWYCTQHDWHETDNAEGQCGYALMLTRATITTTELMLAQAAITSTRVAP